MSGVLVTSTLFLCTRTRLGSYEPILYTNINFCCNNQYSYLILLAQGFKFQSVDPDSIYYSQAPFRRFLCDLEWVNLDFGIKTCFVEGLTGFWKTWLQFIFPFYIWAIAGVIIVAARYSTRLANILTNKAVPILNTLRLHLHDFQHLHRCVRILLTTYYYMHHYTMQLLGIWSSIHIQQLSYSHYDLVPQDFRFQSDKRALCRIPSKARVLLSPEVF